MHKQIKEAYRMNKGTRENPYARMYDKGYTAALANLSFLAWIRNLSTPEGRNYYYLYKALDKLSEKERITQ